MGPPSLPIVIVIKHNTRVIVDYIKESCIPALFHIAQVNSTSPDTGISPSDFQSEASFRHMVKSCPIGMQYTLQATGACVGFTAIFPSEMCRSCRPISTRGFTVLDRKVHNMGLGQAGTRMVRPWAKHNGIPGHIARSSATNTLGSLSCYRFIYFFYKYCLKDLPLPAFCKWFNFRCDICTAFRPDIPRLDSRQLPGCGWKMA